MTTTPDAGASHFIKTIIKDDLRAGKNNGRVVTRFPPEPNGYLHIGHAKSICLNFGLAREFGGVCHLRFDDTNPLKENVEYVQSIQHDVRWLGYDWQDKLFFASDYFPRLHVLACELIKRGKAYVCSLSSEEIRAYRGTLTEPGKNSPFRDRGVEENLNLFERMRQGEFADGEHVLRAKIDMASPNVSMRDPVIYRIKKAAHHRTGDTWCIYPMYDFAHCLSDSIEGITHSICTLEFENNRPLYHWFLDALEMPEHPQQIEFARLNLSYTVLSKRKLIQLVQDKAVAGWDDPRMPTISGLRRRGVPPQALRTFCDRIGVARADSIVDISLLEHCIREYLNVHSPRVMGVLKPLKVVLTNYPEDAMEKLEAPLHPENPEMGARAIPFARELYIEQDDFMEDPPKKFFRLAPGREVRLRYGYYITCREVVKDEQGRVVELRCEYDPASRGGGTADGRKVKATLHWVCARTALPATVRIYDHLFTAANPNDAPEGQDFRHFLNPQSLETRSNCLVEPHLGLAESGSRWQFERLGYFSVDPVESTSQNLVFNRIVSLRDTWAKVQAAQKRTS
jgi:glutaminyl-tRNA synthetase